MKGTVICIKNKRSAVLCENGSVISVKGVFPVGKTVTVPERSFSYSRLILAAAAFLIAVTLEFRYCVSSVFAYGYITVNSTSSVELTLNRKGNVISVQANDEYSESAAEELRETLVAASAADAVSYITKDDKDAAVFVSSNDTAYNESISSEIEKKSRKKLDIRSSDIEEYTRAKEAHMERLENEPPRMNGDPPEPDEKMMPDQFPAGDNNAPDNLPADKGQNHE